MMTLGHFLYIPGVLLLGLVIGYVLGGRSAAVNDTDARARDLRREAREARRRARAEQDPPQAP